MVSPPHDTTFTSSSIAGQKRPAPALLPAFEPSKSSHKLPPPFRSIRHASKSPRTASAHHTTNYLPSAPTSATYIPTSSPSRQPGTRRQGLQRTISALSERAPLATLPSIELDRHGEPTLLGRSSTASHHQLSTNKLISRVHVRAFYIATTVSNPNQIQIECTGWNGVKVQCQGKAWDLYKGDTFTSETEDAEILIDVHDSRVLIKWPTQQRKIMTPTDSDGTWDSESSPSRQHPPRDQSRLPGPRIPQASPLLQPLRPRSPVSPSSSLNGNRLPATNLSARSPVHIYEDAPLDNIAGYASQMTQSTQHASQHPVLDATGLRCAESEPSRESDEENDPIIHSFGPYGANLNSRMGAISTNFSPETRQPLESLGEEQISPQRRPHAEQSPKRRRLSPSVNKAASHNLTTMGPSRLADKERVVSSAITHLMYSQLSATPLSTLLQHVHAHLATGGEIATEVATNLSSTVLRSLLESTPCIGSVLREGKDAAGKPLESEFYYVPEFDADKARKDAVQTLGIGGRGLRSCRKSHKQYYWRKPK